MGITDKVLEGIGEGAYHAGRAYEKGRQQLDKHEHKVAKLHEYYGVVTIIIALVGLAVWGGLNPGRQNEMLFSISVILIVLWYPAKEYSKAHLQSVHGRMATYIVHSMIAGGMLYAIFLLTALITTNSLPAISAWNSGTVTYAMFAIYHYTAEHRKESPHTSQKVRWAVIQIVLMLTTIWFIPWGTIPGTVGDYGAAIKDAERPFVDAVKTCVVGSSGTSVNASAIQQCVEKVEQMWYQVEAFLKLLPFYDVLANVGEFMYNKMISDARITAVQCWFEYGGPSSVYNSSAQSGMNQCFKQGVSNSTSGSGTGLHWDSFEVDQSGGIRAILRFDKTLNPGSVQAADFTVSPASIYITSLGTSGSTITLDLAASTPPSPGDSISVSIVGTIEATSGESTSTGGCSDNYDDGAPSTACSP